MSFTRFQAYGGAAKTVNGRDLVAGWKYRSGAQGSLSRRNCFTEHYSLFESERGECQS